MLAEDKQNNFGEGDVARGTEIRRGLHDNEAVVKTEEDDKEILRALVADTGDVKVSLDQLKLVTDTPI